MSRQHNSGASKAECARCRKSSNEIVECQKCSRVVCKDCMDEYSGLCVDCTIALVKSIDEQLNREIEREDFEPEEIEEMGVEEFESFEEYGSKCRHCGADIWEEESEYGEIEHNLGKYGYVVCPKCGMTLFPEDLVDE